MARFTLLVRPNGSALLVTAEPFRAETLETIRAALDDWITGQHAALLLTDTEVLRITELDVDLEARLIRRVPVDAPTPEPAEASA